MFQMKPLLILTFLGLISLGKTKTQPNEVTGTFVQLNEPYTHSTKITPQTLAQYLYPPHIINLLRKNFLLVPIIASKSAIHNEDVYLSRNFGSIQHKRHPKSVFIVYPENQRPPIQPCNPIITESYTTIPPPTTVVENHKTCDHPSNEHLTTIPLPVTTQSIPTTGLTTSFISSEPTMTSLFPTSTSTSKNPTKWTTPTTISTIGDKQTTATTRNPNQITPTTSHPLLTSTNRTPRPTRPTIYPPTTSSTSPEQSPPTSTDSLQKPSSTATTIKTGPTMTSAFPNTSTSKNPTKWTTPPTMADKQTAATAINPNQTTPTTSHSFATSTNRTPKPTRPTMYPPTMKDPAGIGERQCSFNGLFRANNFTCDQYLVCINGISYLMNCPNGLAFNDDTKSCDWPGNVVGCNPRAFENFECPYDMPGESNKISTFRYRNSCSQFIACYRGKPRLLNCKEGFSFDEDSEDCVYFKNVTNCVSIIYDFSFKY